MTDRFLIWHPDTCSCELTYGPFAPGEDLKNEVSRFKESAARCNLHRLLPLAALANAVQAHNQTFNSGVNQVPQNPTPQEIEINVARKRAEKARILNLPIP